MSATVQKTAPKDYLERMNQKDGAIGAYKRAYEKGMSLSAYLENEMPSDDYNDGLDAFERMLKIAGIRVRSIPELGVWADEFGKFFESDATRALCAEYLARCWRRAATGKPVTTRALYTSGDTGVNTVVNATQFSTTPRADFQIAPAIPLAELIALTTGINAGTYEAFYLTNNAANQRMVRVAEGAEIPGAKLVGGDHTIKLKKYGRRIIESYEAMRRMRIDRVALLIQRMAAQNETDKVAAVLEVMINGDGNTGTAGTSYSLTTLDAAATPGTLSLAGWLAFLMKFANPYMATIALARAATVVQMMTLDAGSANIPLAFMPTTLPVAKFRPINSGLDGNIGVGWTEDAPALKIVAADSRFAIERVFEIGGNIQEVENVIRNQTREMTLTEVEGYVVFDPGAVKILDINT